jgi:tRNA A37 threonylcarbamoyltransferase TsaD
VVNAASASSFGYTNLDKINKMAAGGMATRYDIPRMALGGKVNMDNGGLASNSNSMYNINVNVNNSNADARDIAYAIRKEMQLRDAMNGRDRTK